MNLAGFTTVDSQTAAALPPGIEKGNENTYRVHPKMVDTIPNGLMATRSTAIFSVVKSSFSFADAAKDGDATGNKIIVMAHNITMIRLVRESMSDSFRNRLNCRLIKW